MWLADPLAEPHFSSEGKFIVSGSEDRRIYIWETDRVPPPQARFVVLERDQYASRILAAFLLFRFRFLYV